MQRFLFSLVRNIISLKMPVQNNPAKIYIKSKRIEISPLNDVYFQIHIYINKTGTL